MTMAHDRQTWKVVLIALGLAAVAFGLFALLVQAAEAQQPQGRHGHGHDVWHGEFYSRLQRPGGKGSCCNLNDCVPTTSRTIGGRYEVLVEGEWTPVDPEVIQRVTAPDGGAHVCYPKPTPHWPKGTLFCVVLPPET